MAEPSAIAFAERRAGGKSAAAFRTISEVASELDVPPHVLRFWESKFAQVKPLKRGGGRRYYRPEDIELLRRIRELLYTDGYTIKGVQKLLREGGFRTNGNGGDAEAAPRIAPAAPRKPDGADGPARPADSPRAAAAPAASAPVRAASSPVPERDATLRGMIDELERLRDRLRAAI